MDTRKKRITRWIIAIAIAALLLGAEFLWKNVISVEKEPFIVCAPEDMEKAFKHALKMAGMNSEYEIIMTDDPTNANILVDYAKEKDESFIKFAFSTFIVGYSPNNSYSDKLAKNSLFVVSPYIKDAYEINLTKLIDDIIANKDIEDYGIEGYSKMKVVYPAESTIYWHDFYNLMLIAANNGKYPVSASDYAKAVSKLNSFFASKNTEGVTDFEDRVIRYGGFTPDIFYIMPEIIFLSKKYDVDYIYPTETLYFNYYLKADELGSRIIPFFDERDFTFWKTFYDKLYNYRTDKKTTISSINGYIEDVRNVYNIVPITEAVHPQIEAKE